MDQATCHRLGLGRTLDGLAARFALSGDQAAALLQAAGAAGAAALSADELGACRMAGVSPEAFAAQKVARAMLAGDARPAAAPLAPVAAPVVAPLGARCQALVAAPSLSARPGALPTSSGRTRVFVPGLLLPVSL
jgi:hypothetical protein